ncbi:hypothetical protein CWATWH0005_3917 [Crocosphaera watsonii WH 0005]|uniref:Uncharacterized protein n=1 Tax=Crocosphaera watsonii WH 0005 TaxID=423472 RepID=T2IS27_CROWT|nr:hypothetical protein CWATWH0005_3917 [Crocosphaera watsonii WH 0005]
MHRQSAFRQSSVNFSWQQQQQHLQTKIYGEIFQTIHDQNSY